MTITISLITLSMILVGSGMLMGIIGGVITVNTGKRNFYLQLLIPSILILAGGICGILA
jgi:hypothetical protein